MLYILTALFCEAKPYISRYGLKRHAAPGNIQLFASGGCCLAVGGCGPAKPAATAAFLFTRFPPGRDDVFAAIGAAGSAVFTVGDIVLCHKIVNASTGRAFYPEMLRRHPFREGSLESVGRPARETGCDLADMEGASAYEAASIFLPASQINCIKIVSDNMSPETVAPASLGKLMEETAGAVCGWLDGLKEAGARAETFSDEENSLIATLNERLRLTFAMSQKLRQTCGQAKIRGVDAAQALSEAAGAQAKGKNEAKAVFGGLMKRLLEE